MTTQTNLAVDSEVVKSMTGLLHALSFINKKNRELAQFKDSPLAKKLNEAVAMMVEMTASEVQNVSNEFEQPTLTSKMKNLNLIK